jgi:mannose/cellobiose epimerase-like protein (N-acyl-D-glucosamine 2-epimerase family)
MTIADEAKEALLDHVLAPYLAHCVDEEHGGFLVDFDQRWQPCGPHEKSLEHAARTTLAFALLHRAMPGEGCDKLARHGCAFLKEAMWDREHGGFFARVDRRGRPLWEGMKHPHGVTYAALAFRLVAPVMPDAELWASRALNWLDSVAWDESEGGYWGSYRRDNQRYAPGSRLPTHDGKDVLGHLPDLKDVNMLADAIAMLAAFASSGAIGKCAERLDTLVGLLTERLIDPAGIMPYAYRRDWRPVAGVAWTGHQFQMARTIALAACSPRLTFQALARSRELVDSCLLHARHPQGGFRFAFNADGCSWLGAGPTSQRVWWVQLEAVHALHVLGHHEAVDRAARAGYLRARDEQWVFVRDRLLDRRYGGLREFSPEARSSSWRDALRRCLARPTLPSAGVKSHAWKDPSHEVAALIALAIDRL